MRNSTRLVIVAALFVIPALCATSEEPPKAAAGTAVADDAMMQEMMKLAAPGEHHKRLQTLAGNWTTHSKAWLAPNQPPIENDGVMEASLILGGRYLVSHHTGSFMGMPFEGQAIAGYDNVSKKYVENWVDNMGTGILNLSGTCDEGCKVLTETGEMVDPATGTKGQYKAVTTFVDANNFRYEAFYVDASGHSAKVMEMRATRKK
jgi:Protein of unknown function (DUF1579)